MQGAEGLGILSHCNDIEIMTTGDDARTWELRHDFCTVILLNFSIFFLTTSETLMNSRGELGNLANHSYRNVFIMAACPP